MAKKIAFNEKDSQTTITASVDLKNSSVKISIPPGTHLGFFAPVARQIARYYSKMEVFLELGNGQQLPLSPEDTPKQIMDNFQALTPPAKKSSKAAR